MTAVNYGWTLSASCWIESQQQRTLEGWTLRVCLRVRSPRCAFSGLSMPSVPRLVLEMLAGFAQEFFTRNVEAAILFLTLI